MFSTCCFGAYLRLFCLFTLLAAVSTNVAYAQSTDNSGSGIRVEEYPRFEIEVLNENDMYLMLLQDQYYTNGLFVKVRKSIDFSRLKPTERNRLLELTLGHQIYNAYTAQIDSVEAVDRPIAAYFFLSGGMKHFYRGDHFFSYSLELGTLGKRAFGEVLQVQLHRLLNMYEASGWEYQLQNAWGANAHLCYNGLIGRWGGKIRLDCSINPTLSVGTHDTRVSAAPLIRLGRLNSFASSAHFNARLQSNGEAPAKELYFFYRPETSFVYYDATLQGGMFVTDKGPVTSDPNKWLFSNQFGAVLAARHLTFKVRYFFNTKEAGRSMFRHQYGSLSLAYQF